MLKHIEWKSLIGKKIVALRVYKIKRKKKVDLDFVLFDDKETFLRLSEQDYYDYHDCSASARHLILCSDPTAWKAMMDKDGYDEPQQMLVHIRSRSSVAMKQHKLTPL